MWFDDIGKNWCLSSRSNIKNYNNEIDTFLRWIKPHIASGSGTNEMYAIVIYEESKRPTIYYLDDNVSDEELVSMPRELTYENGAKSAFNGEFKEKIEIDCEECESETIEMGISWDLLKDIYKKIVRHYTS